MALIVICGFIFARVFNITEKEEKFLSKLLLCLINPSLIINAFNIEYNSTKLKQLLFVFAFSIVIHFVMFFIAYLFTCSKKSKALELNTINRLSIMLVNCGFIGIPLIRGVFGDEGVFYLMGFLVTFNIFMWTYGFSMMSGKVNIKKIITNQNIIAVLIGIIIFIIPYNLPEVISKPISMVADMNSPTAMLLIGILFSKFKFEKKYLSSLIKVCLGRLVIVGLIVLAIVTSFYALAFYFGFANETLKLMLFVILICSLCPSATSIPSLACLFNKDASYASMVVCLTSLLCILTVPSFAFCAEKLFLLF